MNQRTYRRVSLGEEATINGVLVRTVRFVAGHATCTHCPGLDLGTCRVYDLTCGSRHDERFAAVDAIPELWLKGALA